MDADVRRAIREIRRRKIVTPGPDQYVGPCQWSKTGWAVWNNNGGCTCEPAKRPDNERVTSA